VSCLFARALKSEVSATGLQDVATITPTPNFAYPGASRWDPFTPHTLAMDAKKLVSPDGSASRSLTPTRAGDVCPTRDFRCHFLRTALAQRITLP
jgi:hypothetical protein